MVGRNVVHRSILVVACLLAPGSAGLAVELQPGVAYSGGTVVEVAAYGIALTVPAGWQGVLPQGSEIFVMTSPSVQGYLLVSADESTLEETRQAMGAPISLGDGVVLSPRGSLQEGQGALSRDFDVQGAQQPLSAHGRAVLHGSTAVVLLAITPPAALADGRRWVADLAATLSLTEPSAAAAAGSGSGSSDRWDVYLKGIYLARYYTRTGFTSERHLWLCTDGSFSYRDQSGGFGGGASGAFSGGYQGRWSATGSGNHGRLTLRFDDGDVAEYELSYSDEKLFLDGERWLRGTNEVCR